MTSDAERGLASAASRLERSPADPGAWAGAARALEAVGSLHDAARAWRKVLHLAPDAPDAWMGLGQLLARIGVRDEPAECYRRALQCAPGRVDLLVALGLSTIHGGIDESGKAFSEALRRKPDDADALAGAAMVLERRRHLEEAWDLLGRIRVWNTLGAVASASIGRRLGHSEQALRRVDKALANGGNKVPLLHARGDLLDALDLHRAAFDAYADANRHRGLSFDADKHRSATRALAMTFSPDVFGCHSRARSERPVFIVGMPRSGTTLVEQVLSRHPDVNARGELEALRGLVAGVGGYPIPDLDEDELTVLGERYLAHLGTDGHRATDKMPHNVLHLGFAARIVPCARVIFVHRDPVDAGWSCFRQAFGAGHPWATSLDGIAAWYGATRAMMDHWSRVLPLPVHTVSYEQLVADPEPTVRGLLSFLELPFNDACLTPERSERVVYTSSHGQVTDPIHTRHIGRSAPYRKWLGPIAALGGG